MMRAPRRVWLSGALALAALASTPAAGFCGVASADPVAPVTTINGSVPPGTVLPLQDTSTMLDTVQEDGNRLVVWQGVRKAGTRVPIHVHDYGGLTCVLSGTITDFMEGSEPMTYPAGTCYYMPPHTPMSAANLGTEDVRLTDTFTLPPGEPTLTVLEPGWQEWTPADASG